MHIHVRKVERVVKFWIQPEILLEPVSKPEEKYL
ncbi:hypothetical protein [Leptospira borgpetersenii]|nr:hypothetical protein [Leptospira borgpetersenii]